MRDKNRNNSDLLSHAFLFLKCKEKYKYMHICIELLKHKLFQGSHKRSWFILLQQKYFNTIPYLVN